MKRGHFYFAENRTFLLGIDSHVLADQMAMSPVNSQDVNNGYVLSSRYILDTLFSTGVITIGDSDSVKTDISDSTIHRFFQTIRFYHRELLRESEAMKQSLAKCISQPISENIRRLDQMIHKRLGSELSLALANG